LIVEPKTKRIGRIALWLFAALGFFYCAVFAAFLIHDNTPLGCYVAKEQRLAPGSDADKAARIVLARAIKKYPTVDFSRRWVHVYAVDHPLYFDKTADPFWNVSYSDPPETNVFGCHRGTPPGVRGQVRKSDMTLIGDVGSEVN
jgi:hypothetical protein